MYLNFGTAFVKILQGAKEENWMLPVMFVVCVDLRNFALRVRLSQKR